SPSARSHASAAWTLGSSCKVGKLSRIRRPFEVDGQRLVSRAVSTVAKSLDIPLNFPTHIGCKKAHRKWPVARQLVDAVRQQEDLGRIFMRIEQQIPVMKCPFFAIHEIEHRQARCHKWLRTPKRTLKLCGRALRRVES